MESVSIPKTVKAGRKKKVQVAQPGQIAQPSQAQQVPQQESDVIEISRSKLAAMKLQGMSLQKIADHFGISLHRLKAVLKKFNAVEQAPQQ